MKLFTCLLFCLLAHGAFALSQSRYFGLNADFIPFFTPITQFDNVEEEPPLPVPTLPSMPTSLLILDNNGVPAVAQNVNSNGEGRLFGALFALRTLANNNGLGGAGLVINTPLNISNVNNNTVPTPAAAAATVAGAAAPTVAAPTVGTRFIPYPDPYFYNRRSQYFDGNSQQSEVPGGFRGTFRRFQLPFRRNVYANLPRVQYLRK